MGEIHAYIFVRKPEGKKPQRKPRHRWEDDIRMDLGETGRKMWIGFIWLCRGQWRAVVNMEMNLWVP
jgi:hypothetical protein